MRTLKELAQEALDIQNACNMSGLAHGFGRMMGELCDMRLDATDRNRHPLTIVWLDKMNSLAGIQIYDGGVSAESKLISAAYDWAHKQVKEDGDETG